MNWPWRHGSSKYICISKFSYQMWKAKTDRTERKADKSTVRVENLNISLLKIDKIGGPARWQRNRIRRPPSPLQIYKKIICMWKNSHRTSFACWQSTPDFQKGKPISTEWGRRKVVREKRDKGFGMETYTLGREPWRRKSFCTLGNPLTAELEKSFGTPEGNAATCAQKAKWKEITTEIVADQHLPAKMLLACPAAASMGWVEGFGGWTLGRGLGLTAVKILWSG